MKINEIKPPARLSRRLLVDMNIGEKSERLELIACTVVDLEVAPGAHRPCLVAAYSAIGGKKLPSAQQLVIPADFISHMEVGKSINDVKPLSEQVYVQNLNQGLLSNTPMSLDTLKTMVAKVTL